MFKLNKLDKISRKYEEDLWNLLYFKRRKSNNVLLKLSERFGSRKSMRGNILNFNSTTNQINTRKSKLGLFAEIQETRKKLCLFYGGISKSKYRSLNKLAFAMKGNYSNNMSYLLELMLSSVIFRMNLVTTPLAGMQLILSGNVFVNKEVIKYPHFIINEGDVVEVSPLVRTDSFYHMTLKPAAIAVLSVLYHEINYALSAGVVVARPTFPEVPFTFNLNGQFFLSEYLGKY